MLFNLWNLLLTISSIFTTRQSHAPADEYPFIRTNELPSGKPYVPQTYQEIEEAAHALYGHGDDIVFPEGNGRSYAGINGDTYRWDGNTIPLSLSQDVAQDQKLTQLINQAIAYIESVTCIRFVSRKQEPDYVKIIKDDGKCYSSVGCLRIGPQDLSLGRGCSVVGTVIHELAHAIGLWHEHCRTDRDQYIIVHENNVLPGKLFNFNKTEPNEEVIYGQPYKYDSMMHYGGLSFSKDRPGNLKTMEALDGTELLDPFRRTEFTQEDINTIQMMYGC